MTEEFDNYGNKIIDGEYESGGRPTYCVFPDCGCDGERLCMAVNGASVCASVQNVEGMYRRTDKRAVRARMDLAADVSRENTRRK